MADLGGFKVQTPQELLAQMEQRRQAVRLEGTVAQNRQYNVSSALDTLFGNPQVNQAQALQKRIQAAEQSVPAIAGEDELTTEMRRLSAIRDAVGDLSPETASQITGQLLKLSQARLEQQKLKSDETRAAADDAREAALHPLQVQAAQQAIDLRANEGQNYWRSRGGKIERMNVAATDSLERRKLRMDGWVEGAGPSTEAEATDALGLNKPVVTDLQTAILDADAQLDGLAAIMQKYDPSFTQLATRVTRWGQGWAEKLGANLPADQAANLQKYNEWRRNSIDSFNRYIKFLTGAAMSVKEADRIQKAFPNAEGDSHTQYISKLREVARQTLSVRKRAQLALGNGLRANGDQWDNVQLPAVTDAEVDSFMGQMGFGPSAQVTPGPTNRPTVTNW
jgi:hypothetical protein